MSIFSRRKLLWASGMAACVPLSDVFATIPVRAQTTNPTDDVQTSAPSPVRFSRDLAAWTTQTMLTAAGNITSGKGTVKDWRKVEGALRTYAKHLEDGGIDKVRSYLATLVSKSGSGDFSGHPAVDTVYQTLRSYGGSVSWDEIAQKMRFSNATMQKAVESTAKHGYSYHYHQLADFAGSVATTMTARTLAAKGYTLQRYLPAAKSLKKHEGRWMSAVYDPGSGNNRPHFELVSGHLCRFMKGLVELLGISDKVKDDICDALTDGGIVAGATTVALATNIVCDGLTVASIIATDGVAAVIAGPLEGFICDALSVETSATVTGIMAALTCALNC